MRLSVSDKSYLVGMHINLTQATAMLCACLMVTACNRDEPGCTDPTALNYDADATTDDGSCTYDTTGGSGEGGGIQTAECVDTVSMDGYDYVVVAIGSQCWFAENLRTTVFQDSTEIPLELGASFPNLLEPARAAYSNSSSYSDARGFLYNGYATVDEEHGGICPTGWHVPTELDWMLLEAYLVGEGHGDVMGDVLKSTSGWNANGNGSDLYGFNAKPAGICWPDGNFYNVNNFGHFSSSTWNNDYSAMQLRTMAYDNDQMARQAYWPVSGHSIRCLQD